MKYSRPGFIPLKVTPEEHVLFKKAAAERGVPMYALIVDLAKKGLKRR